MRACCLALLAMALGGCPKQVDTRVAGPEEGRIDSASARLEQLRLTGQREGLSCQERCELAPPTCELSTTLCAWAEQPPVRPDLLPRCILAREQCAQARQSCTHCRTL